MRSSSAESVLFQNGNKVIDCQVQNQTLTLLCQGLVKLALFLFCCMPWLYAFTKKCSRKICITKGNRRFLTANNHFMWSRKFPTYEGNLSFCFITLCNKTEVSIPNGKFSRPHENSMKMAKKRHENRSDCGKNMLLIGLFRP